MRTFITIFNRHPVLCLVLLGLILRTIATLSGYGWFAIDDYLYVIEPAARYLDDPAYAYASLYRSPLVPKIVSWLIGAGRAFGAEDPRSVLQFAYWMLGLWSLIAIPGIYLLVRRFGESSARMAALLMAAHALMPRLSTRALIEIICIVPLVWSLVFLDRCEKERRFAHALIGGLLFGVAVMIRFQVGIAAIGVVIWCVLSARRQSCWRKRLTPFAGFALAGIIMVGVQGALDLSLGREFFGTPLAYLKFNMQHSSKFGVSAWYNYILLLIGITLPPITIALAKPLWRAIRAQPLVSISLAVFVVAHSLVPHKEDRFLFPMLPLVFALLAVALVEIREASGIWKRRAFWAFWAINSAALVVATLSDGHRNLTVPFSEIALTTEEGTTHTVAVVGRQKRVPHYYLGSRARASVYQNIDQLRDNQPDWILMRQPPTNDELNRLREMGIECTGPRFFHGDLVDRALLFLNPDHNKRRKATALLDCRSNDLYSN